MFPEIDYDFEKEAQTDEELLPPKIGRTALYDFGTGQYAIRDGKIVECSEKEAVRQWVGFLVKTTADRFAVYEDTGFGTYIENYIGYKDTAFVASEIKREIEEKAELNRAISEITDFTHEKNGSLLKINLTVVMEDQTEVEVEVDV